MKEFHAGRVAIHPSRALIFTEYNTRSGAALGPAAEITVIGRQLYSWQLNLGWFGSERCGQHKDRYVNLSAVGN